MRVVAGVVVVVDVLEVEVGEGVEVDTHWERLVEVGEAW